MSFGGTFTQDQLNALTAAIGNATTRVEYDGKIINYASINDMLKLRDRMMRELSAESGTQAPPLARRSVFLSS